MRESEKHEFEDYKFTEEEQKLIDNTDIEEQDKVKQSINEFNTNIDKLSELDRKSGEQLTQHASVNSGFHDYEHHFFMTKRKLRDLCELYRVFFENDPNFSSFIKEMREYTELDPLSDDNYAKEMEFVRSLPKRISKLEKILEEQDAQLRDIMRPMTESEYNKLPKKEKKQLIIRSETLDNRRRALASFSHYFEIQTKGDLSDLEALDESNKQKIRKLNAQTGHTKPRHLVFSDNWKGRTFDFYYINAAGVKLDARYSLSNAYKNGGVGNFIAKAAGNLVYDLDSAELDMRDAPIFPHEPRMTDLEQRDNGCCYMYSGLSEVARLYPQKIKDMIKDNGDGTATVRFFATKESITGEKYHFPVYVRVDKTMPAFNSDLRFAHTCFWANLIEKAYTMSGLHLTHDQPESFPIDPSLPQNADWKPRYSQIEGGLPSNFLETILGDEGTAQSINCPTQLELEIDKKIADWGFKVVSKSEEFFNQISSALDKGLPITCGSKKGAKSIQGQHAYSVIGAYPTDDVPPKYIIRLKNPWTGKSNSTLHNGTEYVQTLWGNSTIWVNVEDGIFDLKLEDFIKDCDRISVNGNETLVNTPKMEVEGYNITSKKDLTEFEKKHITADEMTDLIKVYNDLYDSMISTDFIFSRDSDAYKNLIDGMKEFRHNLAQSFGKNKAELKKLTKPLLDLTQAYIDHVDGQFFGASDRQLARKRVCKGILTVTKLVQKGINPQQASEKIYAEKLMKQQHKKRGINDPALLKKASERLYNNKAFRNIANSCRIKDLLNPSKSQMNMHLATIEKNLKGRGLDKDVKLDDMKPKPKQTRFKLF